MAGIEPASESPLDRESYVCSHIGASDGCESFVKDTKLGDFFGEFFRRTLPRVILSVAPSSDFTHWLLLDVGPSMVH